MHATPEEDEDELALAAVAELVAADPPLALDELDELLPHAVSTQLSTTTAPSARMGRHPITRISTSLGSLTHGRPTGVAEHGPERGDRTLSNLGCQVRSSDDLVKCALAGALFTAMSRASQPFLSDNRVESALDVR
jgi:hypothetical protein